MLRLLLAATIGFFCGSSALIALDIGATVPVWHLVVSSILLTLLLIGVGITSQVGLLQPPVDLEADGRDGRVHLARILSTRATGSSAA